MSDLGNKEVFSKNLKRYMELNNKTRNEMCDTLGFKYSTFNDWYNGKKYPRIDKIEMLANYFGINKSDLIEDKSNNNILERIATKTDVEMIPIVGVIRAGEPITAIENIEGYFPYPTYLMSPGKDYFILRVQGDSMNQVFNENDLLFVEKTSSIDNGQLGVVLIDGESATVKKVIQNDNMITLIPCSTNPNYIPKMYDITKVRVEIVGKVRTSFRTHD